MNIERLMLCFNNVNSEEGIHLGISNDPCIADKTTILKVIQGLQYTYDNITEEEIESINKKRKELLEQEMRETYSSKRTFRRSKNRSKSWVFRCVACGFNVDDGIHDYYWYRDDINAAFCSKKCAKNYVGYKDNGS